MGTPWVGRGGGTFSSSSTTSMCTSPRTDSPLMWVMRSPARRPASWAGLPSSTLCGGMAGSVVNNQRCQQVLPFTCLSFLDLGATQRMTTGEGMGQALGWGEGGQPTHCALASMMHKLHAHAGSLSLCPALSFLPNPPITGRDGKDPGAPVPCPGPPNLTD